MVVICPSCGAEIEVTVLSLHPSFRYGVNDYSAAIRLCDELKNGRVALPQDPFSWTVPFSLTRPCGSRHRRPTLTFVATRRSPTRRTAIRGCIGTSQFLLGTEGDALAGLSIHTHSLAHHGTIICYRCAGRIPDLQIS